MNKKPDIWNCSLIEWNTWLETIDGNNYLIECKLRDKIIIRHRDKRAK